MEEKDLNLGIEGVSAQIRNNTLIVTSRRRMNTLSSAVLNGGFVEAKSIVNHQVPRNWENHKPDKYLQKLGTSLKLPEPIVGMMTSVDIRHLSASVETTPVRIVALVSAGVRHSVAAGEEMTIKATGAGTINIILLIDGNLTPSAMVEAVKIATEAKVLKLGELLVRSIYSGKAASGTPTDSIAIGVTGRGSEWRYSGSATDLGRAIARATKKGLEYSLTKNGLE